MYSLLSKYVGLSSWQISSRKKSRYKHEPLCVNPNATYDSNQATSVLRSICLTSKVNICSEAKLDFHQTAWAIVTNNPTVVHLLSFNGFWCFTLLLCKWQFTCKLCSSEMTFYVVTETWELRLDEDHKKPDMQKHYVEIGKMKCIIWIDFKCWNKHERWKDSRVRKEEHVALCRVYIYTPLIHTKYVFVAFKTAPSPVNTEATVFCLDTSHAWRCSLRFHYSVLWLAAITG